MKYYISLYFFCYFLHFFFFLPLTLNYLSYVLQELVESERTYVQDLAFIVEGYIGSLRDMELSDEDREKVKIIFANIEQILDFHKTFFIKEMEKSLNDHEAAGNAFIKYVSKKKTTKSNYHGIFCPNLQ